MIQKPAHLATRYAEQFQDFSIVDAYRHRPPYPAELFPLLAELVKGEPRRVLDVGCGCGNIARELARHVEQLDAVDFSQHMLEKGRRLPNGDSPHLRWLYGRAEDVALNPPYGLVTAGESLHWMDWNVVLPRFQELLLPGGFLAIINHDTVSNPWYATLSEIIPRYTTNKEYYPYDMQGALERHGLFQVIGERKTAPLPFTQSLDDYIESFHSRNGFSRERMDLDQAAAFDREAKQILLRSHPDGLISLDIVADIVWGLPLNPGS